MSSEYCRWCQTVYHSWCVQQGRRKSVDSVGRRPEQACLLGCQKRRYRENNKKRHDFWGVLAPARAIFQRTSCCLLEKLRLRCKAAKRETYGAIHVSCRARTAVLMALRRFWLYPPSINVFFCMRCAFGVRYACCVVCLRLSRLCRGSTWSHGTTPTTFLMPLLRFPSS